jgi:iron complex transport system substrate-binding protein
LDEIRERAKAFPRRPRVYFEEWDEPMISAIRWVSELVEIAGGEDVFRELSFSHAATGRVVPDGKLVVERQPDVIFGSWCGKKYRPERVAARPGWQAIPAVRNHELHEVKSAEILQPGPAALSDGVRRIHEVLEGFFSRS